MSERPKLEWANEHTIDIGDVRCEITSAKGKFNRMFSICVGRKNSRDGKEFTSKHLRSRDLRDAIEALTDAEYYVEGEMNKDRGIG